MRNHRDFFVVDLLMAYNGNIQVASFILRNVIILPSVHE